MSRTFCNICVHQYLERSDVEAEIVHKNKNFAKNSYKYILSQFSFFV
jgi:hypothetical protein